MNASGKHDTGEEQADLLSLDDSLRDGLALLWRAYNYAQDTGSDVWEFALEMDELRRVMTICDVRWLVAKGYAEHKRETTIVGDEHRSFRACRGLKFVPTTALVLTPAGVEVARKGLAIAAPVQHAAESIHHAAAGGALPASDRKQELPSDSKPYWDARRRQLLFGGVIVKGFRVPADNQEAILAAFQEEGWPDYIDDPLPGTGDVAPKQRLHNAINRLNQNQTNGLLHFHGNGNGEGVGWKLVVKDAGQQDAGGNRRPVKLDSTPSSHADQSSHSASVN